MQKIPAVMLSCNQGEHEDCELHSFACFPHRNWTMDSSYLPNNFAITPTIADGIILRGCVKYRLCSDLLDQTSANNNKAEAGNRAILSSVPRGVTYTRNYSARVHSAVNTLNRGLGNSMHYLMGRLESLVPKG